jgi:ubiquinol-cytochrome c reductase iron-sulfur subunit
MNDHETTDHGTSTALVRASDDGHEHLPASLIRDADQFENPGLPPHVHRAADVDVDAGKRA